jgi:hypothetical protein
MGKPFHSWPGKGASSPGADSGRIDGAAVWQNPQVRDRIQAGVIALRATHVSLPDLGQQQQRKKPQDFLWTGESGFKQEGRQIAEAPSLLIGTSQ